MSSFWTKEIAVQPPEISLRRKKGEVQSVVGRIGIDYQKWRTKEHADLKVTLRIYY